MSTSEDFPVPLDYSGRALLLGEPTAGTTGNPVNVLLPGGAILRVCSLWSTYPMAASSWVAAYNPTSPCTPPRRASARTGTRYLRDTYRAGWELPV